MLRLEVGTSVYVLIVVVETITNDYNKLGILIEKVTSS